MIRNRGAWFTAGVVVGGVAVLLVGEASGPAGDADESANTERFYTRYTTPTARYGSALPPALLRWSFRDGIPQGWQTEGDVDVRPTLAGVSTRTSKGRFAYQLVSRTERLRPGSYLAVVRGAIYHGGLGLGVLDRRRNKWVASTGYWDPTDRADLLTMPLRFRLGRTLNMKVILFNFAPNDEPSRWLVRDVSIRRGIQDLVPQSPGP